MAINKKFKKKKQNITGRKNPNFARVIVEMVRDCTASPLELVGKTEGEWLEDDQKRVIVEKLPEGFTAIDTLNGHFAFSDARMMNHIEVMARCIQEFHEMFWSDEGASICDLRYDRKHRVWADDNTILQFCYLSIGMGLANWTSTRSEWKNNFQGMPMIKFTCPKRGEKIQETSLQELKNDGGLDGRHANGI